VTPAANVEGGERLRLFCALPLPRDTLDALGAWQRRSLRDAAARLVPPENLHLTLAFLGHRPAQEVEGILAALHDAATGVAPPVLRGGRYRETRSVGMLVLEDDGGRATLLAERLAERLERLGVYERERRPWLPHVTVLRFRSAPRLAPEPPDLGEVSPSEVALYHSVLRPTGAQYEIRESVALGG
jgi:2'-5' RNA ligase